jgi:hypothetical protein
MEAGDWGRAMVRVVRRAKMAVEKSFIMTEIV